MIADQGTEDLNDSCACPTDFARILQILRVSHRYSTYPADTGRIPSYVRGFGFGPRLQVRSWLTASKIAIAHPYRPIMNSHIATTDTDGAIVRRRTRYSNQVIRSEQSEATQQCEGEPTPTPEL